MKKEEIIETLAPWVKFLKYEENNDRTDASLEFNVTGFDDGPIQDKVSVSFITEVVVRELAESVAGRFCDAHTVESLYWKVHPITHARGTEDWLLEVCADVHLAYNGYEEENDDSCDEEGEEMDR